MAAQQNIPGLVEARGIVRRPPVVGMHFLHQAPVRLRDRLPVGALLKTQYFAGLLFGHPHRFDLAARALPPRIAVRLFCRTPEGKAAVEIGRGHV